MLGSNKTNDELLSPSISVSFFPTLTCRWTVSSSPPPQHDGGGENDEERQEVEEGDRCKGTHGHVGLVVVGAGLQF